MYHPGTSIGKLISVASLGSEVHGATAAFEEINNSCVIGNIRKIRISFRFLAVVVLRVSTSSATSVIKTASTTKSQMEYGTSSLQAPIYGAFKRN